MGAHLRRAALAGAATGLRSTVAVAALINRGRRLPGVLANPLARPAAGLGVATELVLDKLPFTGSRLDPPGLAGRLVFAAAAGALIARAAARPVLPAAAVACAAALVTAKVGHDARVAAAERVPPLAAAVVEDALALGLASAAARG
jgi:uncharacterized membrane protein